MAFAGWYRDEALTRRYFFGEAITGNLELWAKWDDLFAVGTEEEPVEIGTRELLAALAKKVNAGADYKDCWFVLTADLALTESWIPIGTKTSPFSGNFDGGLHTISGLTVAGAEDGLGGLFGATDQA